MPLQEGASGLRAPWCVELRAQNIQGANMSALSSGHNQQAAANCQEVFENRDR
jgi:hypothetical protein